MVLLQNFRRYFIIFNYGRCLIHCNVNILFLAWGCWDWVAKDKWGLKLPRWARVTSIMHPLWEIITSFHNKIFDTLIFFISTWAFWQKPSLSTYCAYFFRQKPSCAMCLIFLKKKPSCAYSAMVNYMLKPLCA